ncbi:MAG: inositol monophosphatase family protein [Thermodesulfobacteriota bacterium]
MSLDLTALTGPFLEIMRNAAAIVAEHDARPRTVTRKGRIDLLTETDPAVEAALKEDLAAILPGSTFLAEETASRAALGERTWIIDPLDGTTNFAHGLPIHAVSVALWEEGRVALGAVAVPVLGELFHAVRGGGAFLNGAPISVTDTADIEKSLVATGFPYAIREEMRPIMANLERVLAASQGVRRMGAAAVDLAYVACGRFDAFYESCLNPWDVAAGWLLVEEAGGRVTGYAGQPYRLGDKYILASNGRVHGKASGLLEE